MGHYKTWNANDTITNSLYAVIFSIELHYGLCTSSTSTLKRIKLYLQQDIRKNFEFEKVSRDRNKK